MAYSLFFLPKVMNGLISIKIGNNCYCRNKESKIQLFFY